MFVNIYICMYLYIYIHIYRRAILYHSQLQIRWHKFLRRISQNLAPVIPRFLRDSKLVQCYTNQKIHGHNSSTLTSF